MQFKYILRFWENVENLGDDECWLWKACTDIHGRGVMSIRVDGVAYNVKAPRIAFFLEHGYWPMPMALHSCDTPLCCNPRHIRQGDHIENMRDATDRERQKRGTEHHMAKLTDDDVRSIRQLAAGGCSQSEMARLFGVDRRPIRAILRGETWRHVK